MNQPNESEQANRLKLERLKGTWYRATPDRLYDLCVSQIVRNIGTVLLSRSASAKYRVRETVGPLPSPIAESVVRAYARFYLDTLAQLERDEYFNGCAQSQSVPIISYYDVLMAFVAASKCSLTSLDYKQCMHATSTLEARLRLKLEAHITATAQKQVQIESNCFKLVKTRTIDLKRKTPFQNR